MLHTLALPAGQGAEQDVARAEGFWVAALRRHPLLEARVRRPMDASVHIFFVQIPKCSVVPPKLMPACLVSSCCTFLLLQAIKPKSAFSARSEFRRHFLVLFRSYFESTHVHTAHDESFSSGWPLMPCYAFAQATPETFPSQRAADARTLGTGLCTVDPSSPGWPVLSSLPAGPCRSQSRMPRSCTTSLTSRWRSQGRLERRCAACHHF